MLKIIYKWIQNDSFYIQKKIKNIRFRENQI